MSTIYYRNCGAGYVNEIMMATCQSFFKHLRDRKLVSVKADADTEWGAYVDKFPSSNTDIFDEISLDLERNMKMHVFTKDNKRPKTAYQFFYEEQKEILDVEEKGISETNLKSQIKKMWKEMDNRDQSDYVYKANDENWHYLEAAKLKKADVTVKKLQSKILTLEEKIEEMDKQLEDQRMQIKAFEKKEVNEAVDFFLEVIKKQDDDEEDEEEGDEDEEEGEEEDEDEEDEDEEGDEDEDEEGDEDEDEEVGEKDVCDQKDFKDDKGRMIVVKGQQQLDGTFNMLINCKLHSFKKTMEGHTKDCLYVLAEYIGLKSYKKLKKEDLKRNILDNLVFQ